ncbi:hypothetical protein CCH79_00011312 [Gambusia affinis]|uniref:Tetratricopeptide SHNi-TPR domain-containing protein n=1 Tax=Gambusia affinis TaxID=33528 RepID=A0A315V330_GAMAF|nr:hypothetical protein CCH79_00011312 [Gambusia affinis]
MENSVLGNALEGVPEEEEKEEDEEKPKDSNVESVENVDEKSRDELRVQVYDAMAEKKTDSEKQSEATEESKTEGSEDPAAEEEEEDGEDEPPAEEKEGESEGAAEQEESTDKPEEAGGEEDEDDEETEAEAEELGEGEPTADKDSEDEEVGNLQLAWEMLEVAKVIYRRKEEKDDQLMAAQTHLKLGEVSAESGKKTRFFNTPLDFQGNYNQALEDFQECLKLQLKHLDPDSRLLAETHYQLGVAHSLNLQYAPAIQALNNSISVIKNRLENLQEMMDKAESPEALEEERKEMEELKALLPEIQEKVEDATEGMRSSAEDGASSSSALPDSTVSPADSSSSPALKSTISTSEHPSTVPVSDISHLVRKKRKPESPVKEAEVKRVKQDDDQEPHTNGIHKANGDSAENMEVAK